MLFDALGKDLGFNFHIFKPLMLFLKLGVVGDETIYGFGRGGDIARCRYKAVVNAEIVILLLRADGLASHMPNAMDRDAIREEPPILGLGYISLGAVHTRHIKESIVSKDCFDLEGFA
jgi:hypothetical protein